MNKKYVILILSLLLILGISFLFYNNVSKIKKEIKLENSTKEMLMKESKQRLVNAVITLPETKIIVGLKNGSGHFDDIESQRVGDIKMGSIFKTYFLPREYQGRPASRVDAMTSLNIMENDVNSTHIFLFEDRGDTAIQKSSVSLGGDKKVMDISILPKEVQGEDYRVKITYQSSIINTKSILDFKNSIKNVIIPIKDGHFVDMVIK